MKETVDEMVKRVGRESKKKEQEEIMKSITYKWSIVYLIVAMLIPDMKTTWIMILAFFPLLFISVLVEGVGKDENDK